MVFNTGAALLDAIVLAVVSREKEGTYGYKITQDVRKKNLHLIMQNIRQSLDGRSTTRSTVRKMSSILRVIPSLSANF